MLFVAAVAIIFVAKLGIDRLKPRLLQLLVEYTLAHGDSTFMPPEVASFFSIPHTGKRLEFRQLVTGTHDGRRHSFAVRVRLDSGQVDVLLQDTNMQGVGYHYRATPDGRLISALYAETELRRVDDAMGRFAIEIKKWLEYLETVRGEGKDTSDGERLG